MMRMESSKEIEKMFYQDSFSKKKIGSNVHRRTGKGSPTAKVSGGVRFAKNNFKKYEKNSRVKEYNLYENILTYNEFNTLDENDQEEVLYEWMLRYPKIKIRKEMGIGESRLNAILDELNIYKRLGEQMLSEEELERYKNEFIPRHIFDKLADDVKFELVDHYQNSMGMTNKEIAGKLNYAVNSLTSKKSEWKKEFERRADMSTGHQDDFLLQGIEESDKPNKKNNYRKKAEKRSTKNTFSIRVDGEYAGSDIKERIKAFDILIHENDKYKVEINIEELGKDD